MEYTTVEITLENDIGCVVLNRPEVMNALNSQMRAEIADAVTDLGKRARVVVITGVGRAFCSGQDLGDRTNAANVDMERTLRDEYEPMLRAIMDCPVPTITALNGAAAGAGANLALAADVVIAAHSAYLMQAFTRIGLIPDAGGTYVMPRTIPDAADKIHAQEAYVMPRGAYLEEQLGLEARLQKKCGQTRDFAEGVLAWAKRVAKAMGASLFADKIHAQEAAQSGLIYEAVPDEAFEETWKARAAHLAAGPTVAYQNVKMALRQRPPLISVAIRWMSRRRPHKFSFHWGLRRACTMSL